MVADPEEVDTPAQQDVDLTAQQESQEAPRLEYPTTSKHFNTFDNLRSLKHSGNMLTAERRKQLYWDRARVIAKMVDAFHVFSRSLFFNPELTDQYVTSRMKYVKFFSNIV